MNVRLCSMPPNDPSQHNAPKWARATIIDAYLVLPPVAVAQFM